MSLISRLALRDAVCASKCFRLSRSLQFSVGERTIPRVVNKNSSVISCRALSTSNAPAASHSHPRIWLLEKIVSAALLGVIPAAFLVPHPIMDYALALSLVVHTHWGFEAIVVDYIRPRLFGPVVPKVALFALNILSMAALAGLFYLNYSDVGLATSIKMFARAH